MKKITEYFIISGVALVTLIAALGYLFLGCSSLPGRKIGVDEFQEVQIQKQTLEKQIYCIEQKERGFPCR